MMNWILMDMNSYFASVEQWLRPELRGRAIGIVPVESEGTCVIAASHPAKQKGVKVGTPVRDARRLCPGILLVRARPSVYVDIHHQLLRSIETCTPIHKVYSIDEWTIRLMGTEREPARAKALALAIKARVRADFGPELSCSIGIAPSRLLAKIASNLRKPDGLTILDPAELPGRIESLTLGSLTGIGSGILKRLESHGIRSVRDLWAISRKEASRIWGSSSGGDWWAGFHGLDEPEVPTRRNSMTHASVLGPEFRSDEGAYGILVRLVCRLGVRLRRDGFYARTLTLAVDLLEDGRTTRKPSGAGADGNRGFGGRQGPGFSESIETSFVQDTPTLLLLLERLWARRPSPPIRPLKVGVTVSGLTQASNVPRSLFSDDSRRQRISAAMDAINERCGASKLYPALMHGFRHQMEDKIAFGRIPDGSQ
jgi:DNA polymerase-4